MRKKLFTFLLAIVASVGTLFAESSGTCGENLTWTLSDEGVLTISGTGAMTDYSSSAPWYSSRSSITSVIISDGVTSIGYGAFYDCSSLTSVTIPNSVTSIGYRAFEDCSSLTSVTIGNSVTSIGSSAFSGCNSLPVIDNIRYADTYLVEAVDKTFSAYTIKDGTIWIGSSAFADCSSMTSVIIPNSVTSIGGGAFYDCTSLTSVTIPNSVTSIGDYAFWYCSSLTSVTIPNGVTSIGEYAFSFCSGLTSVEIPNSVTSIGNYAFDGCSGLTSVTIGNSVTSIGEKAFYECSSLTSIVWNAIRCADFTSTSSPFDNIRSQIILFTFGDEVEYVPAYLCSGMVNAEITIKNCKTEIGTHALDNCNYNIEGVYNIVLPDTTLCYNEELIIDGVQCNLQKTPNGKQIWTRKLVSVNGCDSIVSMNVTWKKLPDFNITKKDVYDTKNSGSISYYMTDQSTNYDGEYYYTLNGIRNASLSNLSAGDYRLVFYSEECGDSIVKNITIGQLGMNVNDIYYTFNPKEHYAEVTYRGEAANTYDEYAGTIIIPDSVYWEGEYWRVIKISEDAFRGSSVGSVIVPQTVHTIGQHAFYSCVFLSSLTLKNANCELKYGSGGGLTTFYHNYSGLVYEYVGYNWEKTTYTTIPVYVPYGALQWYQSHYNYRINVHVIDSHITSTVGATSATVILGNNDDATHISQSGIAGGEVYAENIIEYIGLEPNNTYANVPFYVKTLEGDSDVISYSFTTASLELTTKPAKPISATTAILLAETNMSDAEVNCGFEWKRENAPDAMAGTKVYCPVANGTMAGRLKGLKDDVYYKYRAFYQSTAGNTYYGDWQYIFTGDDAVEFDPVMYTYAASAVTETEATLKGYALAGSDEFTEQGFEYWAESRVIPEGANHAPARAYQNAIGEHQSVQATGISMKVTLTNLDEGTVYKYRTYAVVNGAKVYGLEMSFTTRGEYLYTVTFVDYDGTILGSDKVHYGTAATAPEDPSRDGYNFAGWDKDYSNVTDDMTITAQYTISTALPEAATDSCVQKFIRDGQLFIQKSGKTYTIQGLEVK